MPPWNSTLYVRLLILRNYLMENELANIVIYTYMRTLMPKPRSVYSKFFTTIHYKSQQVLYSIGTFFLTIFRFVSRLLYYRIYFNLYFFLVLEKWILVYTSSLENNIGCSRRRLGLWLISLLCIENCFSVG